MSFAIDANILLYASDEVSPFAPRARAFLEQCAAGREVLCLAWTTVMSYLRIATHPAIFTSPLAPDEAMRNIDQGMKETVIGTQQANAAASQLVTLGHSLQGLVKKFQVAEDNHFEDHRE